MQQAVEIIWQMDDTTDAGKRLHDVEFIPAVGSYIRINHQDIDYTLRVIDVVHILGSAIHLVEVYCNHEDAGWVPTRFANQPSEARV